VAIIKFNFSDSRLRFFPELVQHGEPSVETVEITVYYGKKVRLREIVERVIECIEPNYSIFIDTCKLRIFVLSKNRKKYKFLTSYLHFKYTPGFYRHQVRQVQQSNLMNFG